MDNPVEIPCPICGGSTEVEYASTGTSIECSGGDGCHALTVMPCFPEEAERCIRARAGRALQDSGAWLDALSENKNRIFSARSDYLDRTGDEPPGYHEIMRAFCEAQRLTESASNVADERPAPAREN